MTSAVGHIRGGEIKILRVRSTADLEATKRLLREYAEWLQARLPALSDLIGGEFRGELMGFPGEYATSRNALLLAKAGAESVGCVAIRGITDRVCEIKRLFVQSAWRRCNVGRRLARAAVRSARLMGYERVVLSSRSWMIEAVGLYGALGFQPIPCYSTNEDQCDVFLELRLRQNVELRSSSEA